MIDLHDPGTHPDDEEDAVRPGPFWRHALWVVGITVAALALGWVTSLFRLGLMEYGLPAAASGDLTAYLVAWGAVGLAVATILRAVAARVPVYAPGRIAAGLTYLGTRLTLGWRPEAPLLVGMAAIALAAAAAWSAFALGALRRAPQEPAPAER
ncbi:hypothetical protein ACFUJR_09430 [Streptomyces sp. NPDC057271]|uniref:hypothetical protein n=1 Tax=unclassified Streptomyces TaxID=2593676 RepID=UPI00363FC8EA